MFVTNWISPTKIQKISEITNFFRHYFLSRTEVLKMLGITPSARKEIIKSITADDYIETVLDEFSYGDMWVFGKDCDGVDVYVKIALGKPNTNTICISFHTAEHPLKYAFK